MSHRDSANMLKMLIVSRYILMFTEVIVLISHISISMFDKRKVIRYLLVHQYVEQMKNKELMNG